MPEQGKFKSPYSTGEVKALIAPLLNIQPEELGDVLIIARDKSNMHIGVFHNMYCGIPAHGRAKVMDLVGDWLRQEACIVHEESPQHGPGE